MTLEKFPSTELHSLQSCVISTVKFHHPPLSVLTSKQLLLNSLRANPTKWSNTLKKFVGKFMTNCLSVFEHFMGLALNGLNIFKKLPLRLT